MNGYELADEIKTMLAASESYYGEAESYLIKCETMLRQQQAEIEALEASKDRLIKTLLNVSGAEPVAYMNPYQVVHGFIDVRTYWLEGFIPLYTHPVKELTDEEILHQNLIWGQQNGEDYSMLTVEDIEPLISLVRAILRTAQEK